MSISSHRRLLTIGLIGLFTISACEAQKMPKTVVLDMVLFSYLDRPIFDAFLNGKGGDSTFGDPEAAGGSTITGVSVPLGPQRVTWRLDGPEGMSRNGELVVARNVPLLTEVPPKARFIAVHIYPDDTVELLLSEHYPRPSARGEQEIEKYRRRRHGQP